MLDFDLSEEQEMVRQTARSFAENELAPLIEEAEETETFPRQLFKAAGDVGLLGITYPTEVGGQGLDKVADCIAREEVSRVWQSFASSISGHSHLATWPIFSFGSDEQREEYLRPALAGEKIGSFALTEPGSGSDVRSLKTTARRDGGDYIINGSKVFITNGPFCDYAIVVAYTDRSAGYGGMSLFVVDSDTKGFVVARKMKKEGIRASETAELYFDDCRVPARALVGTEGRFHDVLRTLSVGRIGVAANCLGIARGAFEAASAYAVEREQFGKPIGSFQGIAFKIADMAASIESARWLVYRTAWLLDNGRPCDLEASMAKLICSELAVRVAKEALHIFGGYGMMREYPVGRFLRDALVYETGEGTSEIQRMLIAQSILGVRSM
jgi:alkylation response protein AidB-like acyl-CoA dehydrogenase